MLRGYVSPSVPLPSPEASRRRSGTARWCGAILLTCSGVGCDPRVVVGRDADPDLSWSADHESGDFDQWLGDGSGWDNAEGGSSLELSTSHAHQGNYSLRASVEPLDGELSMAFVARDVHADEGTLGAWFFLPEAPSTYHLALMKISSAPEVDRFDINVHAPEGAAPRLRVYEHDEGWITESAEVELPVARWVHVEVFLRTSATGQPRLAVLQDGEPVLDVGARDTVPAAPLSWLVGAAARYVAPSPYALFIDDASVVPGPHRLLP